MTGDELIQVTAAHDEMVAMQTYRDAVNEGSDPAVARMLGDNASFEGLGAAIQAAWLAAIDDALTTAQDTFDDFQGTIV
jgi:hypothetical protein